MEVIGVQLMYLMVILLALLTRGFVGWLASNDKFNIKHFLLSIIPAFIVVGMQAFEVGDVLNLKIGFALFLMAGGFAEYQSIAVKASVMSRKK